MVILSGTVSGGGLMDLAGIGAGVGAGVRVGAGVGAGCGRTGFDGVNEPGSGFRSSCRGGFGVVWSGGGEGGLIWFVLANTATLLGATKVLSCSGRVRAAL